MAECTRPKKRFQPVSGAAAGFVYLCLGFCFLMQRAISSWRLANAGDSLHRQMPSGGRVFARATREKLCQWIMPTIINGFCLILIFYALYSALVDPAGRPLRLTLSMFQNPPISIYSFLSPIVWFIYRLPLFSHSLSLERRRMKSEKGEKSNLHSNDGPRALSFPLLLFPKWRTCASYWLRQAAGADRRHNTHYSFFFFFFSLPNLDELHTEELKIQSEFEPGFSLERNLGNKNKSVCLLVLNFIKRRTIPAVQSLISFCSVVCTALY